jgi:hypothetical protein
MTTLIIKGAIYKSGDVLLRAHYTGNFHTVDCTEYKTKEQIKSEYSKEFLKQFTGKDSFYLEHEGIKYYQCEYSPYHTEDFELLSDLDGIEFYDQETSF